MSRQATAVIRVVALGAYLAAVSTLTQAADDRDIDARFDGIVVHLQSQAYEAALNEAGHLLRRTDLTDRELARALRYQGTAYLLSGQEGEALAVFSSAIEIWPRDPWLLWRRCETNRLIGLLASARRDCWDAQRFLDDRWATNLDPELSQYLAFSIVLTEAEVQRKLGGHRRAIASLEALTPTENVATLAWRRDQKLATLHFDIGEFETAIDFLDKAISATDMIPAVNRAFLYFVRAASFDKLGKTQSAASDFAQAVALDPTNELYLFRTCDFAIAARAHDLAEDACAELVDQFKNKPFYRRSAAVSEALSGNLVDALYHLSEANRAGEADLSLVLAILEAAAESATCPDVSNGKRCIDK